jgi:sulfite reductase beta subunit-like hemoprotein
MTIDYNRLRIEGVYKQNEEGHLMLRVKVPGGVLSAEQALKICDLADRLSNGILHLTTRCSIEFHWLEYSDLSEAQRMLAAVGLTTRGACGGAVRGVSCSTTFAEGFAVTQVLARKLHRHFAGNPHFEGLPKKFKIGVDAGYAGSRHLIQDIGLVYVGTEGGVDLYDVWAAGGLGREPMEGFLLEERIPEARLIPLIEAAVRVHKANTPVGRRVKHLVKEIGEKKFRRLLEEHLPQETELDLADGFEKRLTPLSHGGPGVRVEAAVFAGEIETSVFRRLARVARDHAEGYMAVTADQNVAFLLSDSGRKEKAVKALAEAGFAGDTPEEQTLFRICPGNHECRMGLCATRNVAREVIAALGSEGRSRTWAISGCGNSCAQPQLADFGILAVKSLKGEDGVRRPLFDLYRREGEGFGKPLRQGLSLEDLLQAVADLG